MQSENKNVLSNQFKRPLMYLMYFSCFWSSTVCIGRRKKWCMVVHWNNTMRYNVPRNNTFEKVLGGIREAWFMQKYGWMTWSVEFFFKKGRGITNNQYKKQRRAIFNCIKVKILWKIIYYNLIIIIINEGKEVKMRG